MTPVEKIGLMFLVFVGLAAGEAVAIVALLVLHK
jgi:uncharacterized protein YoaH (UPF0181 family)